MRRAVEEAEVRVAVQLRVGDGAVFRTSGRANGRRLERLALPRPCGAVSPVRVRGYVRRAARGELPLELGPGHRGVVEAHAFDCIEHVFVSPQKAQASPRRGTLRPWMRLPTSWRWQSGTTSARGVSSPEPS